MGFAEPFFKKSFKKPDGRPLELYSRKEISSSIVATNPIHDPVTNRPHMRFHPLRGEWVAYATHRQGRTFLPPKEFNPLAPSRSTEFPTEMPVGEYDVAVFDNLFASFTADSESISNEYLPSQPAKGICEVVVFTQDPTSSLSKLPLSHLELLLKVWADRTTEIAKRAKIAYVLPFENRGVEVGVTLHHPHGQIYAYPIIPPVPAKMLEMQRDYFAKHHRSLLADMIVEEEKSGERLVCGDEHSVAFVPACARYPYEVWVAPKRPVGFISDLNEVELKSFAKILNGVLRRFDTLWDKPFPYLMTIYQAPTDGAEHPGSHFHIEFYPPLRTRDRLKYLAGTEIGAGLFVNDTLPEEKAKELRDLRLENL